MPPLREKEREIAILGSVIQGMEFVGKNSKFDILYGMVGSMFYCRPNVSIIFFIFIQFRFQFRNII